MKMTKKLLWLSQEKYITKVLQRFNMENVVVKIFGHERKPGKDGQIGVVQSVHMYVGNIDRKVSGRKRSHFVRRSPPWSIKGGKGHL